MSNENIFEFYSNHFVETTRCFTFNIETREETEIEDYEKKVKEDGMMLEFVPKTPILCHLAIEQNGLALQHVPEHCRDYQMCFKAVHQLGDAIRFVPTHLKTIELCKVAIRKNWKALKHCELTAELLHYASEQQKIQEFKFEFNSEYKINNKWM